jgi:hypothetical protein
MEGGHDMTGRAARFASMLVVLAGLALRGAAPEWQVREADVRLRVLTTGSLFQLVRVDLPESLRSGVKDVRAIQPRAGQLPAQLVLFDGAPVAVEVFVSRLSSSERQDSATDSAAPVEIYLLKDVAAGGKPAEIAKRLPASLHRSLRATSSLTTRPFTAIEAIRLLGDAPAPRARRDGSMFNRRTYFYYSQAAPGLGQVPYSRLADPGPRKIATMHWATDLRVESPRTVLFGADQRHVAWFVYVDGEPVADWRTSRPEPAGRYMGEPVALSAGLHFVEYVVVQQSEEQIPQLFWREKEAKETVPLPVESQVGTMVPETVLVEAKDGRAGGYTLTRYEQRLRARTDEQFLDLTVAAPLLDGKRLGAPQFVGDGLSGRTAWLPAGTLPAIRVPFGDDSLTFPARHAWDPPTTFDVDVRLVEGPVVLSSGQAYPARIRLDRLDHLPADTALKMRLRWTLQDALGKVLDSGELPCEASQVGDVTAFDVPISDDTHRVEFELRLAGLEVGRRRAFRVLRPADTLAGLRASGRSLFLGDERAVLVCAPLATLPELPPSARKGAPHLYILDDFWATASGPEATLRPEKVLGEALPEAVFRFPASEDLAPGASGELRKFALLPALVESRADAVLLAVGWEDLKAGSTGRELCRQLLFLAQAAHAHNMRATLLALPTLPDMEPKTLREGALLVKELGLRLGVPVVDAFSAEQLGFFDNKPFSTYFAAAGGTVTLTTPNDAGRQRLCDLVRQVLRP